MNKFNRAIGPLALAFLIVSSGFAYAKEEPASEPQGDPTHNYINFSAKQIALFQCADFLHEKNAKTAEAVNALYRPIFSLGKKCESAGINFKIHFNKVDRATFLEIVERGDLTYFDVIGGLNRKNRRAFELFTDSMDQLHSAVAEQELDRTRLKDTSEKLARLDQYTHNPNFSIPPDADLKPTCPYKALSPSAGMAYYLAKRISLVECRQRVEVQLKNTGLDLDAQVLALIGSDEQLQSAGVPSNPQIRGKSERDVVDILYAEATDHWESDPFKPLDLEAIPNGMRKIGEEFNKNLENAKNAATQAVNFEENDVDIESALASFDEASSKHPAAIIPGFQPPIFCVEPPK